MHQFKLKQDTYPYYWVKLANTIKKQTPIIYLHGLGDTPKIMFPIFNHINDRDIYCIELPGHQITPLKNITELRPDYFATYVEDWILAKGFNKIILMGHSMGGGISSMVASHLPHLIHQLVLISPMNYHGCGVKEIYNLLFHFTPSTPKKAHKFYDVILKHEHVEYFYQKLSPELIDNFQQRKWNYLILGKNLGSLHVRNLQKLRRAEKSIHCETLLILGRHDGCINANATAKSFSKKLKQLDIRIFENSGHLSFCEEPQEFLECLLTFIR